MARVDYFAIEEELGAILRKDATLADAQILVEGDPEIEAGPLVAIYLEKRNATTNQSLAAGTRTRFTLIFNIWCWEYSLDSMAEVMRKRDDLVGKVEVALMKNRTISNKVSTSWLDGGQMPSQKLDGDFTGYVAGAEIILSSEVTVTTL